MDQYMDMYNRRKKFNGFVRSVKLTKRTHQFIHEKLPDNAKVLDFGCGNGSLGYTGADPDPRRNVTVTGYDIDAGNTKARFHDLKQICDEQFDCILLSHVLEHCTLDTVSQILEWSKTHSDRLIITVPNSGDNLFVNFFLDITHVRPYNTIDFLLFLESQGLRIDAVYRSELEQGLRWYSTLSRLAFAFLTQTSPYIHYTIFCTLDRRDDG